MMNLKSTFYTPAIAMLDSGQVAGSDNLAKMTTDLYTKSLLLGVPGMGSGVPTLPAPGLNPLAPPPYPIPYIPINNYESRKKAMHRVIKTYFEVRETLILNGSIKSVIKSIITAIRKYTALKKQIEDGIRQLAQWAREIAQLPELLTTVATLFGEILKSEMEKMTNVFANIDPSRLTVNGDFFKQKFASEIEFINRIKNFKVGSVKFEDYKIFTETLQFLESEINKVPDIEENNEQEFITRYIKKQIIESVKTITNWASIFKDPQEAIPYIRNIVYIDKKFKPVLDVLYRFDVVVRFIKPRMLKLARKLKDKIKIYEDRVKTYINEQKEKYKALLKKKLTKQKDPNAKVSFFVKAGKFINDHKKTTLKKIKKILKILRNVTAIIQKVIRLGVNVKKFYEDVDEFLSDGIQTYINRVTGFFASGSASEFMMNSNYAMSNTVGNLANESGIEQLNNQIRIALDQFGIQVPSLKEMIVKELSGKIPSINVLTEFIEARIEDIIRVVSRFVGLVEDVADISNRVAILIDDITGNKQPRDKRKLLTMNDIIPGYDSVYDTELLLGQEGKNMVGDAVIQDSVDEPRASSFAEGLLASEPTPQTEPEFNFADVGQNTTGPRETTPTPQQTPIAETPVPLAGDDKPVPSIKEFLLRSTDKLQTTLANVQKKLRTFVNREEEKLKKLTTKLFEGIKLTLIQLVPVKSEIKDGKSKAELIEYKKKKIKDIATKIKKIVKYIKIMAGQIVPGATQLVNSLIMKKNITYSGNETAINKLINGVYEIKIERLSDKRLAKQLKKERDDVKNTLRDYLYGAELLWNFIDKFTEDISQTDFIGVLGSRIEKIIKLGNNGNNVQSYIDFYEKIKSFKDLKNVPKSNRIKAYIDFFDDPNAFRVLNSGYLKAVVTETEQALMRNTYNYIKNITENPLVVRLFPDLPGQGKQILLFISNTITNLLARIGSWIKAVYTRYIRPLATWLDDIYKKWKEQAEDWIKTHVVARMKNLDLILSISAYNLALKVFWTGFRWQAPDGTKFICNTITPINRASFSMIKPDDGYSKFYDILTTELEIQLRTMVGTVIVPPNTGIPPFPFSGYY